MKRAPDQLDLTGINWSIERGLAAPSLAESAGHEILDAIATEDEMIAHDHEQPKHKYRGYLISGWDSVATPIADDPDFGFHSLYLYARRLNLSRIRSY